MCVEQFWLCSQILDNFFSATVNVSRFFRFKLISESFARTWLIAVGFLSNKFHIFVNFFSTRITTGLEDFFSKFPKWALMFFLGTALHIFWRFVWIESHISCESPDVLQSNSCAMFTISWGGSLCHDFLSQSCICCGKGQDCTVFICGWIFVVVLLLGTEKLVLHLMVVCCQDLTPESSFSGYKVILVVPV